MRENSKYLKDQLITYIGNKRKLLPHLEEQINVVKKRLGKSKLKSLDLFSGSGICSRLLKKHSSFIHTNDLEHYSSIINKCYLQNKTSVDLRELEDFKRSVLSFQNFEKGFIQDLYAPKDMENIRKDDRCFYTKRNAQYIDTVRNRIDKLVPSHLRHLLIAPLLSECSVHVNTSGIFKGFYKNKQGVGQFGGEGRNALARILSDIKLETPVLSNFECDFTVHQKDAVDLSKKLLDLDLTYIDPPYNQHPYGSNYFMLNAIATYKKPLNISKVSGIPKHWNRSEFNKKASAKSVMKSIFENLDSRFLLISYNNEGFIDQSEMIEILSKVGKTDIYAIDYATFRGCRNLENRSKSVKELLFLVEKF